MRVQITDEEILTFIRRNWWDYPSQIKLMQDTIQSLWPEGPPTGGHERVVKICLEESLQRPAVG